MESFLFKVELFTTLVKNIQRILSIFVFSIVTIVKIIVQAYNTSDEFSVSNWLEDNHFSPMPDYFCAQGLQYINILQEFYPKNKIRLIGNLKFDTYFDKIRKFNSNLTLNKKRKYILVLPSTNDYKTIINKIKNIIIPNDWDLILSPHPNNSITEINKLIKNTSIKFYSQKIQQI